jgi:ABC-2 type transport system permease protein
MHLNLRGAWALISSSWLSWVQHRAFFFLLAFGWMIPPLISLFIWYEASSSQPVHGITQADFVTYYLLFILVNQLTYSQTNWTAGDRIRSGDMNILLLSPLPPLIHVLSAEIAGKVVYMLFVVPVVAVLALVFHPALHLSLAQCLWFVPALLLAWLLRFFWGYWLALLAFWATRADALLAVQDALIFLLAGQVAPVVLLPGILQSLAIVLPFRYMIGFPIELLLGQLNPAHMLTGFAYQIAWFVVAAGLSLLIWRVGVRHYTAIGG